MCRGGTHSTNTIESRRCVFLRKQYQTETNFNFFIFQLPLAVINTITTATTVVAAAINSTTTTTKNNNNNKRNNNKRNNN